MQLRVRAPPTAPPPTHFAFHTPSWLGLGSVLHTIGTPDLTALSPRAGRTVTVRLLYPAVKSNYLTKAAIVTVPQAITLLAFLSS